MHFNKTNPLHFAESADAVRLLARFINPHLLTDDGFSTLHKARNSEVAFALVELGVDVHGVTASGHTVLHMCVNMRPLLPLLISRGLDVNAKNITGRKPIDMALNMESAQYLLENGSDLPAWGSQVSFLRKRAFAAQILILIDR